MRQAALGARGAIAEGRAGASGGPGATGGSGVGGHRQEEARAPPHLAPAAPQRAQGSSGPGAMAPSAAQWFVRVGSGGKGATHTLV